MKEIQTIIGTMVKNKHLGNDFVRVYQIELIIVPVILGVGTVCMILFTWKLRAEFSWSIYKNISADLQMKRRYLTYQVRGYYATALAIVFGINSFVPRCIFPS